ncbi:MAG: hypothetical protein IH898_08960 [Planctomycetes bacterium]|nr:hypothetical protein [Planctomycetota bacterium]
MTDFSKRLDEVSARVQDHVQQEEQTAKTERRDQIAATTLREEAINSAHHVAVQFMKEHIEPVVRKMQRK